MTRVGQRTPRAHRRPVSLALPEHCDYADEFEIRLHEPAKAAPETWFRVGLETGVHPLLRRLIEIVHKDGGWLRFRTPSDWRGERLLAWRIVTSDPEICRLEATGSLLHAVMVGRRSEPAVVTVTSMVRYQGPAGRIVWAFVSPVHRAVARYLLRGAASVIQSADFVDVRRGLGATGTR